MTSVKRIQLRRTRGWRMPANTVKVDRTTRYGNIFVPGKPNPFIPGRLVEDRRHAAMLFAGHAPHNAELVAAAKAELVGRNLGCWCGLCDRHQDGRPAAVDCEACAPCHADTLLRICCS